MPQINSIYPLDAGGAGYFRKFSVRGRGGWEIFGLQGEAALFWGRLQNLREAEDFDKFCKNVIEKFLKVK